MAWVSVRMWFIAGQENQERPVLGGGGFSPKSVLCQYGCLDFMLIQKRRNNRGSCHTRTDSFVERELGSRKKRLGGTWIGE